MKPEKLTKILFKLLTLIITILLLLFIIYGLKLGIFKDKMLLVNYVKSFGPKASLIFIIIQLLQVIVPVIPGGASCLAGVLAFGPLLGFFYNYIGLILGSISAYYISKKYGLKLIQKLFSSSTIDKYLKYIKNNKFNKIFIIGIFFPGLPDDLLCYMAGISNISFKSFLLIIILGKPLSLLLYSIIINYL